LCACSLTNPCHSPWFSALLCTCTTTSTTHQLNVALTERLLFQLLKLAALFSLLKDGLLPLELAHGQPVPPPLHLALAKTPEVLRPRVGVEPYVQVLGLVSVRRRLEANVRRHLLLCFENVLCRKS